MKNILLIFTFFISAASLINAQDKIKSPDQQYKNEWGAVNKYIQSNWDEVITKSNDLPNPYIGAWPYPFMFYWDSYFINQGLLVHGLDGIAKFNTKNFLYAVDKYGFVGNAIVTSWGMNRSQPPYLSEMVRDVFEKSEKHDTLFLRSAYITLKKDYLFWTDSSANTIEQHNTSIAGLQRFYHHAKKEEMLTQFEEIAERFSLPKNISDEEKEKFTIPFIVEAATGMDFTPRFEHRCQDFIAVELNCLLYNYEENFDWMVKKLGLLNEPDWKSMATKRKDLVNKYCWDEKRGLYLDYDYVNGRRSKVAAVTALQPLWAGIATKAQAARLIGNINIFEGPWGLATTEKCGEIKNYQWGEASIWAPMQLMAVKGLDRYGYKAEAKRIAEKYMNLVTKNFLNPIPKENKDAEGKITHRPKGAIFEKYKIDGTINDDEYKANEMLGWSAGTFAWCYDYVKKLKP